MTGNSVNNWRSKSQQIDLFKAKGIAKSVAELCGFNKITFTLSGTHSEPVTLAIVADHKKIGYISEISQEQLLQFDIRQPVFILDFDWLSLLEFSGKKISYREITKFPATQRDLAIVVQKPVPYAALEAAILKLELSKLQSIHLFDVFESDKLGTGKKSMALNFVFVDEEKTLTDKETESMMTRITEALEKDLNAEVRK